MIQTITKNKEGGETVEHIFNSLQEIEAAEIPEINKEHAKTCIFEREKNNWFGPKGFETFKNVQNAVNNGWPEGVKKARKLGKDIDAPPIQSIRRRRIRGDRGDALDIHAVNSGAFDKAWTRRDKRVTSAPPVLTMSINLTAAYNVKATTLYWRGAAALKIAEILEDAGYSIEIWAHCTSNDIGGGNYHNICSNIFRLKESGQQIFANNLIACVGLAGFLRGYGFKAWDLLPYKVTSSYGHCKNSYKPENLKNAHIDGLHNVSDQYSAENWIKAQIKKIGA